MNFFRKLYLTEKQATQHLEITLSYLQS